MCCWLHGCGPVTRFKGTSITVALAVTMLGMGLTLDIEDFTAGPHLSAYFQLAL
jgi:predicted Na+-dependent transporter